jgi:hypothetical protein
MKPKLDKARKAWLAGLKAGDEVTRIFESGAPSIAMVDRADADVIRLEGNGHWEAPRYTRKSGTSTSKRGWIVPVTAEYRQQALISKLRSKLQWSTRDLWRDAIDEQILAVAAILWPEKEGAK